LFFSSRRRHTRFSRDWSSDVCSSDLRWLVNIPPLFALAILGVHVFRLSVLTIVLPSLIVPFAGLAFFGYWAVETGITLVPASAQDRKSTRLNSSHVKISAAVFCLKKE